jgi:hypothetical protein
MARIYVDENLAGSFVSELRDFGHDVVFGGDIGPGRSDAWHFREALIDQRILLTLDKRDYQYFHKLWTTLKILNLVDRGHAGILVAVQVKGFTYSDWLPVVQQKLRTPEELSGRMYRWHPQQREWHEDAARPED